jgi:peptidyl-prolyl cis-trans isomerase B (cyclophilin B)
MKKYLALLLIVGISITACSKKQKVEGDVGKEKQAAAKVWVEPTEPNIDVNKKYTANIKTSKGTIVCELFAKGAPLSVTNFKYLADGGFYNGLTFHRVVPDFVVQGGDPTGTGSGGPGYTIKAEIGASHSAGALAWARTADQVNPERRSSGSQFYITYKETPFLDGAYTVFGQTVGGMDVVNKITQGDIIESIEVKAE